MRIIDNINELLGDDLKAELRKGSKLRIAASTFSIFAFEALRKELEGVESLEFIFTSPTFNAARVTDKPGVPIPIPIPVRIRLTFALPLGTHFTPPRCLHTSCSRGRTFGREGVSIAPHPKEMTDILGCRRDGVDASDVRR